MAKSGHRSSQRPQRVQTLGLETIAFLSSRAANALVGQKAIHIPQPLHHFSFISIKVALLLTEYSPLSFSGLLLEIQKKAS
jgi:hypothetical protein